MENKMKRIIQKAQVEPLNSRRCAQGLGTLYEKINGSCRQPVCWLRQPLIFFLKRVVGRPLYDGVWRRDRPNGGLQKLLFDQYMNGRLFYSYSFGLGGECTVSSAIISLLLFYSCLSPPLSAFAAYSADGRG